MSRSLSLLYYNITFRGNILRRTQSRWAVSTEVLLSWYTVESFMVVWCRFPKIWKIGIDPLRFDYF